MQEFKLPDLGEGMQEAEVVQWLVKPGDTVKLDQTMVKVETDKAVVEIPAPVAGRISEICVPDGQVAKVGEVLVVFDSSANGGGSTTSKSANIRPSTEPASVQTPSPSLQRTRSRVLAAPAVRKLAFELGVDLEQVTPSHPNGRISLEDVRAAAERAKAALEQEEVFIVPREVPPPASVSQDERKPLTGLRKRIAEHMERSWRTIPHATAFDEVDASGLVALRQALKPVAEQRNIRLTYVPLLIKLLLPVLKEFPIFNASLDEERREIIYKRSYHIGVAADSPEGLLVPVLRDADRLTLAAIASRLEQLIEGAHERTLALSELSGSTFTLNNVGSFGGGSGTPIINHPEVAILAVGRIQEKGIVHQGAMVIRPMMPLALSFDHRLIDGALAGKFLGCFKELVENPVQLMLDLI